MEDHQCLQAFTNRDMGSPIAIPMPLFAPVTTATRACADMMNVWCREVVECYFDFESIEATTS